MKCASVQRYRLGRSPDLSNVKNSTRSGEIEDDNGFTEVQSWCMHACIGSYKYIGSYRYVGSGHIVYRTGWPKECIVFRHANPHQLCVSMRRVPAHSCAARGIWRHMCIHIVFRHVSSTDTVLGDIVPSENKRKCAIASIHVDLAVEI